MNILLDTDFERNFSTQKDHFLSMLIPEKVKLLDLNAEFQAFSATYRIQFQLLTALDYLHNFKRTVDEGEITINFPDITGKNIKNLSEDEMLKVRADFLNLIVDGFGQTKNEPTSLSRTILSTDTLTDNEKAIALYLLNEITLSCDDINELSNTIFSSALVGLSLVVLKYYKPDWTSIKFLEHMVENRISPLKNSNQALKDHFVQSSEWIIDRCLDIVSVLAQGNPDNEKAIFAGLGDFSLLLEQTTKEENIKSLIGIPPWPTPELFDLMTGNKKFEDIIDITESSKEKPSSTNTTTNKTNIPEVGNVELEISKEIWEMDFFEKGSVNKLRSAANIEKIADALETDSLPMQFHNVLRIKLLLGAFIAKVQHDISADKSKEESEEIIKNFKIKLITVMELLHKLKMHGIDSLSFEVKVVKTDDPRTEEELLKELASNRIGKSADEEQVVKLIQAILASSRTVVRDISDKVSSASKPIDDIDQGLKDLANLRDKVKNSESSSSSDNTNKEE